MLISVSDDSERRAFARGRMVGRTLDRVEWVIDGLLRHAFGEPADLTSQDRKPCLVEHCGQSLTDVHGPTDMRVCHTTSSVEGD